VRQSKQCQSMNKSKPKRTLSCWKPTTIDWTSGSFLSTVHSIKVGTKPTHPQPFNHGAGSGPDWTVYSGQEFGNWCLWKGEIKHKRRRRDLTCSFIYEGSQDCLSIGRPADTLLWKNQCQVEVVMTS
jgi:hypothetical protein